MTNAINWFEIPVENFERAKGFYENVLNAEMQTMDMEALGKKMAFFPSEMNAGVGGAIATAEGFKPSLNGSLVYLNGGDDLAEPLSRVSAAGGQVILINTDIGPNGFIGIFID